MGMLRPSPRPIKPTTSPVPPPNDDTDDFPRELRGIGVRQLRAQEDFLAALDRARRDRARFCGERYDEDDDAADRAEYGSLCRAIDEAHASQDEDAIRFADAMSLGYWSGR